MSDQPFFFRYLKFDLWLQIAFGALAVLLIVFALIILLQALAFTLRLLKPSHQEVVARREGFIEIGFGIILAAAGIAMAWLPDWLPQSLSASVKDSLHRARHISLPILAASLYTLSEGIGAMLFARRRVGAVALIWAMIGSIVWLIARLFF